MSVFFYIVISYILTIITTFLLFRLIHNDIIQTEVIISV